MIYTNNERRKTACNVRYRRQAEGFEWGVRPVFKSSIWKKGSIPGRFELSKYLFELSISILLRLLGVCGRSVADATYKTMLNYCYYYHHYYHYYYYYLCITYYFYY